MTDSERLDWLGEHTFRVLDAYRMIESDSCSLREAIDKLMTKHREGLERLKNRLEELRNKAKNSQ